MKKPISNIVFTKNRPLQLDAYFESLHRYLPAELIRSYVIYKPELFGEEYEELFRKFSDCVVIRERDFHSDILGVLDRIETRYILFGVDDVVYFDSVNFEVIDKTFSEHADDIFGFAMRFAAEPLEESGDAVTDLQASGQPVYRFDWTEGRTPHSRYPFELCSTFYATELVRKIIFGTMNNNRLCRKVFSPDSFLMRALGNVASPRSVLKKFGYFFSPNTFESWNCRWCRNHRGELPRHTYFQKLCASAVQVNMVNTTTRNVSEGTVEHTVEALNEKYKQGYRLDIDFIAGKKPTAQHCGPEYFRLTRNTETATS